jgi:hypothetical protein
MRRKGASEIAGLKCTEAMAQAKQIVILGAMSDIKCMIRHKTHVLRLLRTYRRSYILHFREVRTLCVSY